MYNDVCSYGIFFLLGCGIGVRATEVLLYYASGADPVHILQNVVLDLSVNTVYLQEFLCNNTIKVKH